MAKRDRKPLPKFRNLKERCIKVARRFVHLIGDAYVDDDVIRRTGDAIIEEFGVGGHHLAGLVKGFAGLRSADDLQESMARRLESWIPAMSAGHVFAPHGDPKICRIEHVVSVRDPSFDPVSGKWEMRIAFMDGPLVGSSSLVMVAPRMAAAMVRVAFGPRLAYSLDRPRPYDLHGISILVKPRRVGRVYGIGEMMRCEMMRRRNVDKFRARFGRCADGRFEALCFDCGLDQTECPMARRSIPTDTRGCKCCGRDLLTTNKGVCIVCLNDMMKTGLAPRIQSQSAERTSS